MSEPALTLEYGRPPRRRRWRRVLIGIVIAGLVAVAWHYQKRVRAYVADAYKDWQYRRAFDRAWAQLPMTDGVWLAPTGGDSAGPDALKLLREAWSQVDPPDWRYLNPSTRVLFVRATDQGGRRWLTFACATFNSVEQFVLERGDRAQSTSNQPWNTRTLWGYAPGTPITLQAIKRQGEIVEATIDIDGKGNRLQWEMAAQASRRPLLMSVIPQDGLTAQSDWWPNSKQWTLIDGPRRKRELSAALGSYAIAFMPDGRIAQATPKHVALVRVALREGAIIPMPAEAKEAETFAFSPDGTKLFVADTNRKMWLADLANGRVDKLGGSPGMSKAAFADERTVLVIEHGGAIRIDVATRGIEPVKIKASGSYYGFGAAGGRVAVPAGNLAVELIDLASGKSLQLLSAVKGMHQISLSPDGRTLAVKGQQGFRLYDAESGRLLFDHDMNYDLDTGRSRIKWSADGQRGATAGIVYVYVWSLREPRRVVRFLHGKTGPWPDVALSSDGKRMAVSSAGSGTISYWAVIDEVMGAGE